MSKYKRYERYKDSGVEWIGEIPEHWGVKPLKRVFKIINGGTPSSSEESYWNGEIVWVTPNDLSKLTEACIVDSERKITQDGLHNCSARIVPKGSIVISTRAPIGYVAIAGVPLCTNQGCKSLVAINKVNPKYFYYWMHSISFYLNVLGQGTTFIELSNSSLSMVELLTPSINEQKAIANFLDQKTAVIDDLIADKEKFIELLQEKRQAIITEAVTKGLNPNVRMKDSGIEWIGEIPEHWEVSKIKFTTYVKGRIGWQGLRADEFIDEGPYLVTGTDFVDGLVNWDSCYHISMERYNEAPPIQLRENDLLITKDGTIGKVAIVKNKPKYAILNSGIFVTRPKNSAYLTEFMYWILNSQVFNKFIQYMSLGSTIVHLYQQTFENFSFPITNLNEQKTIAHFLDRKVAEIDGLISDIKLQIQKLKEYRQSLISEAVTGKIDVREFGSISEVI